MRASAKFVFSIRACLAMGLLVGCSSGTRNRQQTAYVPAGTQATPIAPSNQVGATNLAQPQVPPIVLHDTEATTPTSYVAPAPAKPKISGLSEDDVKRCETELPLLEHCRPTEANKAAADVATEEVRACILRYVAAVDACLCKAGSKPYCQYAEDQKRELAKMNK